MYFVLHILSIIIIAVCESPSGTPLQEDPEKVARTYIKEFENQYWSQAEIVQKFLMIDLKNLSSEDIHNGELATFNIRNFTVELVQELRTLPYENFQDAELRRQISKIVQLKDWALENSDLARKISFQPSINKIARRPGLCSYKNRTKCDLAYDPHISEIILTSNDHKELVYYWTIWRDYLDSFISIPFDDYVKVIRKIATISGFNTTSKFWLNDFENDNILDEINSLTKQLDPLYKQLHAFVRFTLRREYGSEIVSSKGPIPHHLLEKIWLQGFERYNISAKSGINKTMPNFQSIMIEKGYTPLKVVQISDEFYKSLQMFELPSSFWENNSIPLPERKSIPICRPIVYDFGRVSGLKYCQKVDFRTLLGDHEIMAKVQYHEHTKELPFGLDTEACPGLWKVIGKAVKLSATSPNHFQKIGLTQEFLQDHELDINFLLAMAIQTVLKLPTYYVYEKYFVDILDGKIDSDDYNCEYWKLQEHIAGVEAPVNRNDDDFDVSIPFFKGTQSSRPYTVKILSEFLGYHLYKILCEVSGQYTSNNPENLMKNCDFHGNVEAGKVLNEIMSLGWKKPCFDVIEQLTKQRYLSADALLEYYDPLYKWLQEQNKLNNEEIGWTPSNKCQKDD